jgi:flagellar biosynthesis chaperone FliJ
MKDTLGVLMRLRQREIDALQQDLNAIRASLSELAQEETAHDAMIRSEQALAVRSQPAALGYGAFARVNADEKAAREVRRHALVNREDAIIQALTKSYIELKKIEHLAQQRLIAARKSEADRERKNADEQAIVRHVRR